MENKYGIEIKKCCGSCLLKAITHGGRKCRLTDEKVASGGLCEKWMLNKALEQAGKGGGTVKKRHYQKYLLEVAVTQRTALEEGRITISGLMSIEQIREMYRETYGSELYNI